MLTERSRGRKVVLMVGGASRAGGAPTPEDCDSRERVRGALAFISHADDTRKPERVVWQLFDTAQAAIDQARSMVNGALGAGPGRPPAFDPEPTFGAGIKRQILSASAAA